MGGGFDVERIIRLLHLLSTTQLGIRVQQQRTGRLRTDAANRSAHADLHRSPLLPYYYDPALRLRNRISFQSRHNEPQAQQLQRPVHFLLLQCQYLIQKLDNNYRNMLFDIQF